MTHRTVRAVSAVVSRTWERFRCTAGVSGTGPSCAEDPDNCISERLVKQHADILGQPEWRDLGYEYVNIDDCWANWNRTADGKLAPNSTRFASGMKALADYVESKGLKLGTCTVALRTADNWLPAPTDTHSHCSSATIRVYRKSLGVWMRGYVRQRHGNGYVWQVPRRV
jgi:hypothetical protein